MGDLPENEPESTAASLDVAFRAVFEGEFNYVWNTLRRLGIARRDLEDVTHEVFIRLLRRLPERDGDRPIRPWIFGFAFRVASEYRRLPRFKRESLDDDASEHLVDTAPMADEALAESERRELFERALASVPLDRRAVLILYEIEERPVEEIASALDLPTNTVYSRLRVGRGELAAFAKRALSQQKEVAS